MSITREQVESRLLETLQADDGAGSDLPTGDYDSEGKQLEVLETGPFGAAIDIGQLTSEVMRLIEEAGA